MSCGVGRRRGSDPALLWLWRRPVATAPIGPLAWEPPYAAGAAQEIATTTTKRQIGWLDRQKKQGLLDSFGPSDDLAPEAAHSLGDEKGASIQVKQDKF